VVPVITNFRINGLITRTIFFPATGIAPDSSENLTTTISGSDAITAGT